MLGEFGLMGHDERAGAGVRFRVSGPGVAARNPRGAYVEGEITATRTGHAAMRYVLMDNPKPASCEILPVEDTRFQQGSTAFVLREDKTPSVLWHHEQTGGQIVNRCVLHAELAGEFTVVPAQVELMYSPDIRGHSGTFRLRVKDEPGVAVTVK